MPVNWDKALQLLQSLVMFGLLIWLFITMKKWYNDESTRPKWLMSLIVTFSTVKYNKMTNTSPFVDSNVTVVVDSTSTTADKCASNCSTTYNCNGFVYMSNTCTYVMSDFGTIMMVPKSGVDTYFRQDKNSPKYGFTPASGDFAFSSNVASQRMDSMMTVVDPYQLANTCIQKHTSNCVGFSYTTVDPKQSWLVNNTSNIESTANVMSYSLDLLGSGDWAEASFS